MFRMLATYPVYLIPLSLIVVIMLGIIQALKRFDLSHASPVAMHAGPRRLYESEQLCQCSHSLRPSFHYRLEYFN
jgi:hypothetical protein